MPDSSSQESKDPFKGGLENPGFYKNDEWGKITQVKSNPEKIVRKWSPEDNNETLDESTTTIKIAKELTSELHDKYGIQIPDYEIVIGSDNKNLTPVVYIVTDRIHGTNLRNIDENKVNLDDLDLDGHFSSIFNYVSDKYLNGGNFLLDIESSAQYMYGHTSSDPNDKIYLVDLDPLFYKLKPGNEGNSPDIEEMIFYKFLYIYEDVKSMEAKLGKPLTNIRKLMRERLPLVSIGPKGQENYDNTVKVILDELKDEHSSHST